MPKKVKRSGKLTTTSPSSAASSHTYPEGLIEFLAFPRYFFRPPFRQQEEGFVEALRKFVLEMEGPDYSTICRRINSFRPKFERSL